MLIWVKYSDLHWYDNKLVPKCVKPQNNWYFYLLMQIDLFFLSKIPHKPCQWASMHDSRILKLADIQYGMQPSLMLLITPVLLQWKQSRRHKLCTQTDAWHMICNGHHISVCMFRTSIISPEVLLAHSPGFILIKTQNVTHNTSLYFPFLIFLQLKG